MNSPAQCRLLGWSRGGRAMGTRTTSEAVTMARWKTARHSRQALLARRSVSMARTSSVQVPDNANIRFGGNMPMSVDMWVYRTSTSETQHFIGKRETCNGDGNGITRWVWTSWYRPVAVCSLGNLMCLRITSVPELLSIEHLDTSRGDVRRVNDQPLHEWAVDWPTNRCVLGPANRRRSLIGATSLACNPFFPTGGLIDEVEIFNRALSQTEIQAIVDAGSFGKCKALPRVQPTPRPRPTPHPRPTPAR